MKRVLSLLITLSLSGCVTQSALTHFPDGKVKSHSQSTTLFSSAEASVKLESENDKVQLGLETTGMDPESRAAIEAGLRIIATALGLAL